MLIYKYISLFDAMDSWAALGYYKKIENFDFQSVGLFQYSKASYRFDEILRAASSWDDHPRNNSSMLLAAFLLFAVEDVCRYTHTAC